MKQLFFTACASTFGMPIAIFLGTVTLGFPVAADAREACVRTSVGDVVCGELISNPSSTLVACNTIIRRGSTLNWMTLRNGNRINQGIVSINSVNSDGSFSATTVNNTFSNTRVDHRGLLNSSNFTLLNPAYNETWTGSCNQQRRIEGQINGNSGITFRIW